MKTKFAVGIVLAILLLVIVVAFSGYFGRPSVCDMQIIDIKVETPRPSLLNSREVTIDPGESVIVCVTVQNKGEKIIYQNAYRVGIDIVYPKDGAKYWILPAERSINLDMGPGGKSEYSFIAGNRKELPFSGNFKIRAYIIRSLPEDNEKLAWSDNVSIAIRPPTSAPMSTETSSPGFEVTSVIAGLMIVLYLNRRRLFF